MAVNQKNARRQPRSLVTKRLERVSKDVFRSYYEQITDLVGNSPGIYALYDGPDLYYVGKSIDLKKRVKQHLKDRHYASWTHFSLYLVRNSEHIHEIESLLVRISNPEGNRVVPKGKSRGELLEELKKMVKRKQNEEYAQMFGDRPTNAKKDRASVGTSLVGLVKKRTPLYRAYKGNEYNAFLLPKGVISYDGKEFSSPSAAAFAIVKRGSVNGWWFWYVQNEHGDWVKLNELRA